MSTVPGGKTCYRILYVDGNTNRCSQMQTYFNERITNGAKFFCVPVSNYKLALQVIAVCHLDNLAQNYGYKPFDFILFDINIKSFKDKYNWEKFIEHIFAMGIYRLKFLCGIGSLIAVGSATEKIKDKLLEAQITFIERPVTLEKIQEKFIRQVIYQSNSIPPQAQPSPPYKILIVEDETVKTAKRQIYFNINKSQKSKKFGLVVLSSLDLAKKILNPSNKLDLKVYTGNNLFDIIIFNLNFQERLEKGLEFVDFIFEVGLSPLNLSFGIGSVMATGSCTESVKNFLLERQISLFDDFVSEEQIAQKLVAQIGKFEGSGIFHTDSHIMEENSQRKLVRRVLRLSKSSALSTIILSYEETIYDEQGKIRQIRPVFKRSADFFHFLFQSDPQ